MDERIPELMLRSISGQIFRHGPDGEQELICSASRLRDGYWLTVGDRGIYGGTVYGQWQGTQVLVDLWMHFQDGREPLPIAWSHQTAFKPITVLYVPSDAGVDSKIGSTALTHIRDYIKIFQLLNGEVEGCSIYNRPWTVRYDVHDEHKVAIAGRCDLGYHYPRTGYGSPLVNDTGHLVGVIIGSDWGTDSSHAGFYVPADFIAPSLELLGVFEQRLKVDRRSYSAGIDFVSHRSSDVYFE